MKRFIIVSALILMCTGISLADDSQHYSKNVICDSLLDLKNINSLTHAFWVYSDSARNEIIEGCSKMSATDQALVEEFLIDREYYPKLENKKLESFLVGLRVPRLAKLPFKHVVKKSEIIYKIDSTTAKSRIQRTLDTVTYDEFKGLFILKEKYSTGSGKNDIELTHTYKIALFPEMKGTAVVYSGEYEYLVDKSSGKILFGQETYDKELDKIKQNVSMLLEK